ncbi:MAG: nicotinate phosphoribosyltransferase [Actinobacteria bacterium]|nr:MAG: nicotinate phosphoribosyltransferase [Actinomycetota bacterium]
MTAIENDLLGGVLATDQYQLTMAQAYWKDGLAERRAQFDYFFRSYPDYGTHQAGYCVTAGLGWLLEWMETARFGEGELEQLRSQRTPEGRRRFEDGFIDWLSAHGDFSGITVDAIPEGRVVHANVPIATVTGPLAMAQILETPFLNRSNYPTLVATKASRAKEAARGRPVLEFGMRRGPESGSDAGSRAALIGGCDFSSNTALSLSLGIDPKGTHAHSLVQVYLALGMGEKEAFRRFAAVYPDECTLLVDTVDTLTSGVPNAIEVFRELEAEGHEPAGIRIDSGDLAYLAIQAAAQLDSAGFEQVSIVLSSDLDELVIWQILSQIEAEAPRYGVDASSLISRLVFGVGTRLVTSEGDPSLGGVYKLVAVDDGHGDWVPAIKVSEDAEKIPIPGDKKVYRLYDERGLATADVAALVDEDLPSFDHIDLFHPHRELHRRIDMSEISRVEELHRRVFDAGQATNGEADLDVMRKRRIADLELLDPGVRRLVNPHVYHVSLTNRMKQLQRDLVARALNGD